MRAFFLFGGLLREGADGSRGEFHLDAVDAFRLNIDPEGSFGRDIRVTSFVPDGGSSSGQFAGSAHNIFDRGLLNHRGERIMESRSWQGLAFVYQGRSLRGIPRTDLDNRFL